MSENRQDKEKMKRILKDMGIGLTTIGISVIVFFISLNFHLGIGFLVGVAVIVIDTILCVKFFKKKYLIAAISILVALVPITFILLMYGACGILMGGV